MKHKVLLVGASTGGPAQIKDMLSSITSLSCTIIVAQHMKEEVLPFFINDLKESLSINVHSTPLRINLEEPSVIICAGSCVVQKIASGYEIIHDAIDQQYTPDINKLLNSFTSFSSDFDVRVLIMTGIGSDGVDGAKALKANGATVFAQDEKSSPVFGMPRVAIESGIVDDIKSLDEIKEYFKGL